MPYNKVVGDNYIATHGILNNTLKKTLMGAIKIKGFDITLLSSEEQKNKIKRLTRYF